jgi:hypothetical protein
MTILTQNLKLVLYGGAFGMSFELPQLLHKDVMDIAKKFVELEYSLNILTTLLSDEIDERDDLIL